MRLTGHVAEKWEINHFKKLVATPKGRTSHALPGRTWEDNNTMDFK
jgi:hypothetical protein